MGGVQLLNILVKKTVVLSEVSINPSIFIFLKKNSFPSPPKLFLKKTIILTTFDFFFKKK